MPADHPAWHAPRRTCYSSNNPKNIGNIFLGLKTDTPQQFKDVVLTQVFKVGRVELRPEPMSDLTSFECRQLGLPKGISHNWLTPAPLSPPGILKEDGKSLT